MLPEAVKWPELPTKNREPVITELPLLWPVDKNVCEAEIKFWPCHEPEIAAAVNPPPPPPSP